MKMIRLKEAEEKNKSMGYFSKYSMADSFILSDYTLREYSVSRDAITDDDDDRIWPKVELIHDIMYVIGIPAKKNINELL